MKIVLLPGLDGTGNLFEPLVELLSNSVDLQIISYPKKKRQCYRELVEYVLKQLPKEDYILLGESFSGYIAYQIAIREPEHLKSVIFVAGFLSNPRPVTLALINRLPAKILFLLPPPEFIIKYFMLGFSIRPNMIQLFKRSLNEVEPRTLAFRLKEIVNLQVESKSSEIRAVYIQATYDSLVPAKAVENFKQHLKDLTVAKIDGPHFILQAKPEECACIIEEEISYQLAIR